MDRPGQSRIAEAFLNTNQDNIHVNRGTVKSSLNNHNDFSEAYLKINEAVSDPRYERDIRAKSPQIQQWNRTVQVQVDQNRRDLSSKMSDIRHILGADPALQPLNSQVNNILSDFDRNPNKDLINAQFLDHNKKRNREVVLVVDEEFSKTNRHPKLSAAPEISRTSTVKIYQNNENVMTRFEVDKEYPGDNVQVVQIKQANQPAEQYINSSQKKQRPVRTPVKQSVAVDSGKIHSNPGYEKDNMIKSYIRHDEAKSQLSPAEEKVIYVNDTDPRSSSKKKPRTVERLIVATRVDSEPSKPDVERVIVQSNDYHAKPQPFQQYPINERRFTEAKEISQNLERARYVKPRPTEIYKPVHEKVVQAPHMIHSSHERTYVYRQKPQTHHFAPYTPVVDRRVQDPLEIHSKTEWTRYYKPQQQGQPNYQVIQERKVQEPQFIQDERTYIKAIPKKKARQVKLFESREVGIMNSKDYYNQQPTVTQFEIENSNFS